MLATREYITVTIFCNDNMERILNATIQALEKISLDFLKFIHFSEWILMSRNLSDDF